jgi:hypothetical protein
VSTEDPRTEVQKLEAELERITQKGEEMVNEYGAIILAYLRQAINDLVDKAITDNPEAVNRLGTGAIRSLKRQISTIVSTLPIQISRSLSSMKWGHRGQADDKDTVSEDSFRLSRPKNAIDNTILLFLGRSGTLLYGARVLKLNQGWVADGRGGVAVSFPYALSNYGDRKSRLQLTQLHERYEELLQDFINTRSNLQQAQRKQESTNAKSRWDSV